MSLDLESLINAVQSPWFSYGEARNISSHTYNKDKAEEVYNIAAKFVNDARYLLDQLLLMND